MKRKYFRTNFSIPSLGLGTWRIGGNQYSADKTKDSEHVLLIKKAIEIGYNHIDTAEAYGVGHTEELVGEAIKNFERKNLFITTKVMPEHLAYDDVISAALQSLARLKTSYIDLYLVHFPNPKIRIKETMEAMDYLVNSGLVKFIGLSNFTLEQIKEAQNYAFNDISAVQLEYNLSIRNRGVVSTDMESKIIPFCQKNEICVIAYRPLAQGKLAQPGIDLLDEMAKKYSKTQAQISLNWLLSKKSIVAIPKSTLINHLVENIGAVGWMLRNSDSIRLNVEFPFLD